MKKHYLILMAIAAFFSTLTTQAQTPYDGIPYEFVPATLSELANKTWARMSHGSFINPGQTLGPHPSGSTHRIITDRMNDNNTCDNGGSPIVLTTLPPAAMIPDWDVKNDGQLRAMRLGDDRPANPLGSQITYYFKPDSERNVIMVYFAFIAENPTHPYEYNPTFTIEVLRANGQRINGGTKSSYFLVNPKGNSPNHNPLSHDTLLIQHNNYYACGTVDSTNFRQWSNWFPVAFDLRAYIGTEIRLRISATDCSPTGHYAYAYFAARGLSSNIDVTFTENTTRYTVPSGFYQYTWYINGENIDYPGYTLERDRNANETSVSCVLTSHNGATMTFSTEVNYYELKPDFTWAVDSTSNDYNVQFTNQSILNIVNGGDTIPQEIKYVAWDFGDGTPISTEINPIHQYANPGSYAVLLTLYDNDRRYDSTIHKVIKIDSSNISVKEYMNEVNKVTLFPNPTTNQITVSSDTEIELIEILNANGQLLISHTCAGTTKEERIATHTLANGIYLVKVKTTAGETVKKIVVN